MSAIARWDAFLAQIAGRHRSVRADAEASSRAFIVSIAAGGDYRPLSNQLSAVHSRLQELETMITDTWHGKVEDAIFGEGLGVADRDREWAKGEVLRHALDDEREELEPRVFAELARQRFAHAVAGRRAVACTKCNTALTPPLSFRAIELTCTCGAITPYEPGELMRSVSAIGTHAIAQEAAVKEWRGMRDAERRLHAVRPPRNLAVVQHYEQAQITYWRSYLAFRSQLEPELARDPALEIRSRMDQWYRSAAEFEESWVKAGRPRAAI
jgi:hypothetical protein